MTINTKVNTFSIILLAIVSMLFYANASQAVGDKIRDANPIKGDACFYSIPTGIDPDDCVETVASTSQVAYLTCNTDLVVWCTGEDNPSSDGNSNPNEDDEEDGS